MLAMLDGFEDIRIERRPLAMKANKNGKSLKIDQLSDGEKCTIVIKALITGITGQDGSYLAEFLLEN